MTILQASPFLERLLRFLIPYFTGVTSDIAAARAEALETLISYGARTRAELLCAVQIIVFSFAALDTLGESNSPSMSPAMRIRFRGCANNLNRSCQKTEQTLARRLTCEVPDATDIQQDPINDIPADVAEDIMRQTQATILNHLNHAAANSAAHTQQPTTQAQQEHNKQLWTNAIMDGVAAGLGMPIKPPSRQSTSGAGHTPSAGHTSSAGHTPSTGHMPSTGRTSSI